MQRSRPFRARNPLLLLLALAACADAETEGVARLDQMRLQIVEGRAMHMPVRDPATAPDDPGRTPAPVVARVSLAPETEHEQGEEGTTLPDRLRLPPVEIHWRVLEPWCRAELSVTPVRRDTASNYLLRPTRSSACHLVAEGVADGRVFDADTAVATFGAGPAVSFQPPRLLVMFPGGDFPLSILARGPLDAYGNDASWPPPYTAELTSGPPVVTRVDTMLHTAMAEGFGNVRMTVGAQTAEIGVWVMRPMPTHWWHLSWECYGLDLPGGAHVDSAHFQVDADDTGYASFGERGWGVGMSGMMRRRMWVRGQPVQETFTRTARYAAQQPFKLVWHNGETATATGLAQRYDGGNLCEPPPEGGVWQRHAPARAVRGDSIPPGLLSRR